MPSYSDQSVQQAQGKPEERNEQPGTEQTRSTQANSESSDHSSTRQMPYSTDDAGTRPRPASSPITQPASTSNRTAMGNLLASNRTSDDKVYSAMQRWEKETPKEEPWNGLRYSSPSNNKDEDESQREGDA